MNGLYRKDKIEYFLVTGLVLLFLLFVFSPDLALAYIVILVIDRWFYSSDRFVSFKYSRDKKVSRGLVSCIIGLAAFLGISTVVLSAFPSALAVAKSGIQSVFDLLSAATPILRDSKILSFFTWGFLIAIIETNFVASLLEGIPEILRDRVGMKGVTNLTRTDLSFKQKIFNPATIFIIILVCSIITAFHFTAKRLDSIPLLITFIFFFITCVIIIKDRERRGAIYLHIVVNSLTILTTYGIL